MLTMEALPTLPFPHTFLEYSDEFAPLLSENLHQDLSFNLKANHDGKKLQEDLNFSFPCFDHSLKETLVTAEEIFNNGQIKPIFPFLHESHTIPTEMFFLEQHVNIFPLDSKSKSVPETIICELSRKMTNLEVEAVEDSKKRCNKRSSIPFLKLWRFRRDLKRQSYNDGKNGLGFTASINKKTKMKTRGRKEKTRVTSAHEQFYVMNRLKKESNKRRSYLPYKLQLLGIFANTKIFSRNLLPFQNFQSQTFRYSFGEVNMKGERKHLGAFLFSKFP